MSKCKYCGEEYDAEKSTVNFRCNDCHYGIEWCNDNEEEECIGCMECETEHFFFETHTGKGD